MVVNAIVLTNDSPREAEKQISAETQLRVLRYARVSDETFRNLVFDNARIPRSSTHIVGSEIRRLF